MDKELPKGILDEEKGSESEAERGSDQEESGSDAEEPNEVGQSKGPTKEYIPGQEPTKTQQRSRVWFCVRLKPSVCFNNADVHASVNVRMGPRIVNYPTYALEMVCAASINAVEAARARRSEVKDLQDLCMVWRVPQ